MSFFMRDKKEEPAAPPVRLTPTPTAPTVVAELPKPEAPTLSEAGTLDFPAIYQFARLTGTRFTAEQTLAMLEELPQAMPLEMKRQTVQVTLNALGTAIGASRSSIVSDATQKRDTLQQYADTQDLKTDDYVAQTESEIEELQRQIAEKESQIATAREKQACVRNLCDTESSRLESVLSFFGEEATSSTPVVTPVVALTLESVSDEEDETSETLPVAA